MLEDVAEYYASREAELEERVAALAAAEKNIQECAGSIEAKATAVRVERERLEASRKQVENGVVRRANEAQHAESERLEELRKQL